MLEHDGCKDCKHELLEETEVPCSGCKGTITSIQQVISNRPDLWEPKGRSADTVNHPIHYASGKYECIDVMAEAIGLEDTKGFCLCNAFKYIYRCTKKHADTTEDVRKAIWYLNKFLELEGE